VHLIIISRPFRALRIMPAHSGKNVTQKGAAPKGAAPDFMVRVTSSGDNHAATSSDGANGGASTRR
jgi:hypothetical protein